MEEFLKQFDKKAEIVVIDSLGSEFPIERVEQRGNKAIIILKRSYKNANNDPLLLKLESNRNENR